MNQVLEDFLSNHPGRDFTCRGLRLHYIDEGQGEPVVMVHGNPTWSFLYRNLIDSLRGSHRVIVPDHIGCGLSDKPDDSRYSYNLKSRVDDLEALLESLGLDRDITLILHDWGGMIGMAYAARHPERIARLVVTNTAAFHNPASKPLPRVLAFCRSSSLAAGLVRGANAFCLGTALIGCKRTEDVARTFGARTCIHMIRGAIGSPCCGSSRISPCGQAIPATIWSRGCRNGCSSWSRFRCSFSGA